MLHLAFPLDLLPTILIYSGSMGTAIKIESILLGLPHQHGDASMAYDSLQPHHFPASMALTVRSLWFRQTTIERVDLNKALSLCVVSWIARFRPHILMWSIRWCCGTLWKTVVLQDSLGMFKALWNAKRVHGFPMDLLDKAVEMGFVDAAEYLWERGERMESDGCVAKAAGNGHLHLIKFLEEKGVVVGAREMSRAISSGKMEVIRHLLPTTKLGRSDLIDAVCSGKLKVVNFILAQQRWKRYDMWLAKKEALERGHYDILEFLCMNRKGFNAVHVSLATLRAFFNGSNDVFAHYRGIRKIARSKRTIARVLEAGNARVARNLVVSRTDFSVGLSVQDLAAKGDLECLKVVIRNSFVSQNARKEAQETALVSGHVHVAEYLASVRTENNVCIDRVVDSGDLGIVEGVFEKCTVEGSCLAMDKAAEQGFLDIVMYLHRCTNFGCTTNAMDFAAGYGHLDVVVWLHDSRKEGCTEMAMDMAAGKGHLDVVQWLHWNRSEGCTALALDSAAKKGYLDIVTFLNDHRAEGCTTEAIDVAAASGLIDIVKCLGNRAKVCTTDALDKAAANGYLDIVRFLSENRPEGCTTQALDKAAANGHLDIVRYLTENRSEGCTTEALDGAAANGHLDVVKYLHFHRSEGCSKAAMDKAAGSGARSSFRIVKFLHTHRSEGCTTGALDMAAALGHIELVRFLHFNRSEGCTNAALENAASHGFDDVVRFLMKHREERGTNIALRRAISGGYVDVARLLKDSKDRYIYEVLVQALRDGSIDMLRFLLEEDVMDADDRIMKEVVSLGYLNQVFWLFERGCVLTYGMLKTLRKKHSLVALRKWLPNLTDEEVGARLDGDRVLYPCFEAELSCK
ncbi:hypothetical protein HDU97_008983 [Phlyctochytrium planicorne]|nr:hypothetical protein HDU97_008983 [Phlyctochytrium planicorne]